MQRLANLRFTARGRCDYLWWWVASGFRLGLFLWIAVNHGPAGFNDDTFTGPVLTIWSFGEFLVPLAILELYLRAEKRGASTGRRVATATIVFVATLMMAAGTFVVAAIAWLPAVQTAGLPGARNTLADGARHSIVVPRVGKD